MNKTVLIVEDEPDLLTFIRFRLKKMGYRVLTAKDGKAALAFIETESPDLIFLDIRLPEIDGYEVCRRIKQHPKWKSIPIIFSTADSSIQITEAVKTMHADDYLLKPFDPEQLMHTVKTYLK